MDGIFYERQIGGLCRMHACNAYFGRSEISQEVFAKYKKEFDDQLKNYKCYNGMSCDSWDFSYFCRENLVSYIMKKYGVHCRIHWIQPGHRLTVETLLKNLKGDFIFVFNQGHIFGLKRVNDQWYKVDSLSGVSRVIVNAFINEKHGFMIPVNPYREFYSNISKIKIELKNTDASSYLRRVHNESKDLGKVDVLLSSIMSLLKVQGEFFASKGVDISKTRFAGVQNKILQYDRFNDDFEKNYLSVEKKIEMIGPILKWLCTLGSFIEVC